MPEAKQDTLILQELVRRANTHTQRLRSVDEQMRRINSKVDNIEQQKIKGENLIKEKIDKIMESIESINNTISEMKNDAVKLHEKEKTFAKKKDVEELFQLVDLLSPVKHEFVTWPEFNRELKKLKGENEVAI
ncbi:MAG: hypothetical protein KAU95_04240 [Candidatus Aenigmarchaeota archaeon]|nr:hypothetical protein [Candidatus Aenigmarchaeota archaeon]